MAWNRYCRVLAVHLALACAVRWEGEENESTSVSDGSSFGFLSPKGNWSMEQWLKTSMGNHTAAELNGITQNSAADFQVMKFTACFNLMACLLALMAFLVLRMLVPAVYSNETRELSLGDRASPAPRLLEEGLRSRLGRLCIGPGRGFWDMGLEEEQIVERAGLDGLMLLEFHRLGRTVTLTVGSVLFMVLCPLHYAAHSKNGRADLLSMISISSLNDAGFDLTNHGVLIWAHVAVVWFVVLATSQLLYSAQTQFLERRFAWLKNIPVPRSTTLMIENLPDVCRSDEALQAYFARLFSEEAIIRAYVVRRTGRLQQLVKKRDAAAYYLQCAEETWEQHGRDPARRPVCGGVLGFGGQADAIETYSQALTEAAAEVRAEQKAVRLAVKSKDPAVCSCTGFVTFNSRRLCMLASRQQYLADSTKFTVVMPPDIDDVNYNDLAKDPALQTGGSISAMLLLLLIFFVWMPLVALSSGMASLPVLKRILPGLDELCGQHPQVEHLLEGVLATAILKIFMAFLPSLLMGVANTFLTQKAGAWAQLQVQDWYFAFQVIFILLVTAIVDSLLDSIEMIIADPKKFDYLLAGCLPESSNFYIKFVMLGCVAEALNLLRIAQLAKYALHRLRGLRSAEARRRAEPEDQDSDGMGSRMAKASFHLVVALVFCSCSPVIMLFAWAYFAMGGMSFGYLVVFAETRKPDMGGNFWVKGLRHIFVGLAIYVLLMTGIVARATSARAPSIAAAAALGVLLAGVARFESLVWQALPFEAIAEVDFAEGTKGASSKRIYAQPECNVDAWDEVPPLSLEDQVGKRSDGFD